MTYNIELGYRRGGTKILRVPKIREIRQSTKRILR